jgi:hypothetical protein
MSQSQRKGGEGASGIGLRQGTVEQRPSINAAVQAVDSQNVHIEHGANDIDMAVAGFSVSKIKRAVAQTLNIPSDAIAFVNGEKVSEDYILQGKDRLEFLKESGRKGFAPFAPAAFTANIAG